MILGIGFSGLLLAGILALALLLGRGPAAGVVGAIPPAKSSTYGLSVLPMFIFIGLLAFHAGVTRQPLDPARKWIGLVPGGRLPGDADPAFGDLQRLSHPL